MSDMILEPFTARLRFVFPDPKGIEEWSEILKCFLEASAILCRESGPCLIGHIKGLVLLSGDHYLRVSVVSPSLPAQVETNVSGAFAEMTVTLNMLVYGLPKERLESILNEVATRPRTSWSERVTVVPVTGTTRDDHSSHDRGC